MVKALFNIFLIFSLQKYQIYGKFITFVPKN